MGAHERVWSRLHVAPSSIMQARSSPGQPLRRIKWAHDQPPLQELCWGRPLFPQCCQRPFTQRQGAQPKDRQAGVHQEFPTSSMPGLAHRMRNRRRSEGAGGQSRKLGESQCIFHIHVHACSHVYAPTQAHTQRLYPQGVKSDCLGIDSNSTSYYETLG